MKFKVCSVLALAFFSTTALAQTATDKKMDAVLTHGESQPLAALAAVKLEHGQPVYQYYGGFAQRDGAQTVRLSKKLSFVLRPYPRS